VEGPWICCGDFNEVLSADEHLGSNDRSETLMSMFSECLDECGLMEIGLPCLSLHGIIDKKEMI
jgi:hypothetical protein